MEKKYIFHYDKTQPGCSTIIRKKMIAHDEMECSADIEDCGVLDVINVLFDDGTELSVFVYELEEVNEMDDKLVDKIASFFETEENWRALKECWLENDRSDDLRKLLRKALKM